MFEKKFDKDLLSAETERQLDDLRDEEIRKSGIEFSTILPEKLELYEYKTDPRSGDDRNVYYLNKCVGKITEDFGQLEFGKIVKFKITNPICVQDFAATKTYPVGLSIGAQTIPVPVQPLQTKEKSDFEGYTEVIKNMPKIDRIVPREEIMELAMDMESRLRQNEHKGTWKECSFTDLSKYIMLALSKLMIALGEFDKLVQKKGHYESKDLVKVLRKSVDMCNYVMFLWDVTRERAGNDDQS